MGFLNFGKKKKNAMPEGVSEQSMTLPPNPPRDNMLPSLSDEKLDGLKLPELPDLNELGGFPGDNFLPVKPPMNEVPSPKQESVTPPVPGRPVPLPPRRNPAPASNNNAPSNPVMQQRQHPSFPSGALRVPAVQQNPAPLNRNSVPMYPSPIPRRGQPPAQRAPKPSMRIPNKLKDHVSANMKKSLSPESSVMKLSPRGYISRKRDPLETLKATTALGDQKDPALLDDFLSDEVPDSVPYEVNRHSNFSDSGDFFVRGEDYRTTLEAINSVASIKSGQINTSESFNFSHSLNDKFERTVEKIKNKIISVDELLFE